MEKLKVFFELIRVKQWAKNIFIFAPIAFAKQFGNLTSLTEVIKTFGIFCILSSSIYILNDIQDIEADRIHPLKKNRPMAAGIITKKRAYAYAIIFLTMAFLSSFIFIPKILTIMLAYLALHLIYNAILKKIIIVDAITVAIGFTLRLWAGAIPIDIVPSEWLQACVFPLVLFISFLKRRQEMTILAENAHNHRATLGKYSTSSLDQMISVSATASIVFYVMYILSSDVAKHLNRNYLLYTTVFVFYGIFRYSHAVRNKSKGEEMSEILLSDMPFLINLIAWVLSVTAIIYFQK